MRNSFVFSLITIFLLAGCSGTTEDTLRNETEHLIEKKETAIPDTITQSSFTEKEKIATVQSQKKPASIKEENSNKKPAPTPVPPKETNKTAREKKGNVIEFHQAFSQTNEEGEYVSEKLNIDLSTTAGGMLSAYSLYKSDYHLHYRVLIDDVWSEWETLPENPEVNNPNRKAFLPKQLESSVSNIQFKSDQKINQEVVFRIFTFSKN